jgi:RNA polymerase sigma-70 factor (ECF subfamily)
MIRTVQEASQLAFNVERWIAEARGGSRAALERLLEACAPYLLLIANRELYTALRSRLDPMDVVQVTLMKAWRHFSQFRGQTELDWLAWLWQILLHNLANERRTHVQTAMRSIQREVRLTETVATPCSDDAGNESESPDRQAQAQELQEMLEGALRRLPKYYRQVLQLHTQEEMTFAQVGERLHCSAEAARKLWRRAAEKLTRLLGEGNASAKHR